MSRIVAANADDIFQFFNLLDHLVETAVLAHQKPYPAAFASTDRQAEDVFDVAGAT